MADCKACGAWFSSTTKTELCPTCERALKRLNGYAVPVVHGQWIPLEYDGYADGNPVWDLWECSECREEHSGDEDTLPPYCPNCGTKMDEGDEDGKRTAAD